MKVEIKRDAQEKKIRRFIPNKPTIVFQSRKRALLDKELDIELIQDMEDYDNEIYDD